MAGVSCVSNSDSRENHHRPDTINESSKERKGFTPEYPMESVTGCHQNETCRMRKIHLAARAYPGGIPGTLAGWWGGWQ